MSAKHYICSECGFRTLETPGVYNCPHCGNQMSMVKSGVSVDFKWYKWLIYFLEVLFLLPCLVLLMGLIGMVVFAVFFVLIRMLLIRVSRNYAIKKNNAGIGGNSRKYVCRSCGHSFKGKELKCPICDANLRYG